MKIKKKREAGEILERGGIASRIIQLADDISQGTYKNTMERAGQIAVLVDSASYDDYWTEKANIGKYRECDILLGLIEGDLKRDRVAHFVNPYIPR
jgi:hypothetical protein